MRTLRSFRLLPLVVAIGSSWALADTGVGVDTWRGNKLDPTAGQQSKLPDERGTSWLAPGQHRSPTGNLYMCPADAPDVDTFGDWIGYGSVQIGGIAAGGDKNNALWNRFADWDSGILLGLLDYTWQRPSDGTYANVRASRISDDDQYYQAVFGRAGAYKVQAFVRDMPNIVSSTARPIWNGVGSNDLTLPSSLTPGGSTPAEVAAVSAATPERTLSVKRSKQGLSYSTFLTPEWTAYANLSDEERKGARPYGGPFFFAFAFSGAPFFVDTGGVNETVKPIDDSTVNVNVGLRYAGSVWRMDIGYQGSFYRDANTRYTFESPFTLSTPLIPGAVSAPLYQGQMSTEPDNNYHNLQMTLTRKIALDGEISLSAAAGRMTQNDQLIPPIDCQGVFGIGLGGSLALGPQNPYLYSCSDWNTTAALSRPNADMRIDTSMFDARMTLHPASDVTLRGGFKFDRQDYRNVYVAFNPLTGQYGYVSENGSQGSIVPGEIGFIDPLNNTGEPVRISSLPLDIQTIDANIGADWRLSEKNTLGATFDYNRYEPTNRERQQINDSSLKLTWVNRSLDWLTLRVNYTYLKQSGDNYNYDPYDFTYSNSLPGYAAPDTPAHTVDALRKYDMSSRDENKLDVMATFMPRDDMTVSASLRGDRNSYDAQIGRQDYDTYAATLQWEWQPAASTSVSAFAAIDRSRLKLANVQDQQNGAGTDPTLGGPNYAYSGMWWLRDHQRDWYGGATLNHVWRNVKFDAAWNYLYSRGEDNYQYATSCALAYPADSANCAASGPGGGGFPAMVYRVNSVSVGATMPLSPRISLRVFDQYERGHVSDWHYLGFDAGYVVGDRVYTDGGPVSYSANLIGVLLNVKL